MNEVIRLYEVSQVAGERMKKVKMPKLTFPAISLPEVAVLYKQTLTSITRLVISFLGSTVPINMIPMIMNKTRQ